MTVGAPILWPLVFVGHRATEATARLAAHAGDSAMLVRGQDRYQHFAPDLPAIDDLEPAALAHQQKLERQYQEIAGNA